MIYTRMMRCRKESRLMHNQKTTKNHEPRTILASGSNKIWGAGGHKQVGVGNEYADYSLNMA